MEQQPGQLPDGQPEQEPLRQPELQLRLPPRVRPVAHRYGRMATAEQTDVLLPVQNQDEKGDGVSKTPSSQVHSAGRGKWIFVAERSVHFFWWRCGQLAWRGRP